MVGELIGTEEAPELQSDQVELKYEITARKSEMAQLASIGPGGIEICGTHGRNYPQK